MARGMEREFMYGRMEQSMKGSGRMIWLMARDDSSTQMAICIKETGLRIELMVLEQRQE